MTLRIERATTVISALLLLAVLGASPVIIGFAATSITVSTDKPSYFRDQTLIVSGTVSPLASGQDVAIVVNGPSSELKSVAQVTPSANGTYSTDLIVFRLGDPTGTWTVKASCQGVQALTTFMYVGVQPETSSISCSVSSSNLTIGDSVRVSGSITPARSGVMVTVSQKGDGSWNTLAAVASASDGGYSYSWKPALAGSYQLKASWEGDSLYMGATSSTVSVTVNKIPVAISCKASSSEITDGDTITISGSINPTVSGRNITLSYTKPDGNMTVTRNVTTGSNGSYSDSYKPDTTGSWTVKASWDGDSEHQGAASQPAPFTVKKPGCIIATSTYGSELAPEVQFLRSFRDNTVLNTFAGRQFMVAFNAWYYSFSPSVASEISTNQILRGPMKLLLYPLIGILHLASSTYLWFSFSPELGVLVSGIMASSLIGVVYVTPCVLILCWLTKNKITVKAIRQQSLLWLLGIAGILSAETIQSQIVMMLSTAGFVLTSMCVSSLLLTRSVQRLGTKRIEEYTVLNIE